MAVWLDGHGLLGDVRGMECPSDDVLVQLLHGELDEVSVAELDAHLDTCVGCREAVSALARTWTDDVWERGDSIERYVVLDRLGEGAMGVVHSAYDPKLDRRVAIKVLRAELAADPEGRERLEREARALARLAHPNVVSVFDAGHVGEHVYIVLEYIEGETLEAWMSREHEPAETLAMFAGIARGLAAAHTEGLVHRDFKPSNVLVGRDGRPRITDFGLAAYRHEIEEGIASLDDVSPLQSITRAGALLGTPAYMSPEQLRGRRVGAAADQYSFCLVLYECLSGSRLFAQSDLTLMREVMEAGAPHVSIRGVRAEVSVALTKGLHPDPTQRLGSMDEWLEVLEPAPPRRSRSAGLVTGTGVLLVLTLAAYTMWERTSMCRGGEEAWAAVVSPQRLTAVEKHFTSSGAAYAAGMWSTTQGRLSAYGKRWIAMHGDACRANQIQRTQSDEVYNKRMVCLQRGLYEVDAVLDVLVSADEKTIGRADRQLRVISPLDDCANLAVLTTRVPLPTDPAVRVGIEEVSKLVATGSAQRSAGKLEPALVTAKLAVDKANALAHPLPQGESLNLLAEVLDYQDQADEAQATFRRALLAAERAQDDLLAADVAIEMAKSLGYGNADPDEGLYYVGVAEAKLARAGGAQSQEARLAQARGLVLYRAGRLEESLAAYIHARDLREKLDGRESTEYAHAVSGVGLPLEQLGRYEESIAAVKQARDIFVKHYGEFHPDVGTLTNNIGVALQHQGKYDEARAELEKSLVVRKQLMGVDHPDVAQTLTNLGLVHEGTGDYDGALQRYREAQRILEASRGPEHFDTALTYANQGNALRNLKKYDESKQQYARALKVFASTVGVKHPYYGILLSNLGEVELAEGRTREARSRFREAIEKLEAGVGPEHVFVAYPLTALGELDRDVRMLERAVVLRNNGEADPALLASSRFALAKVLVETDASQKTRALKLAQEAKAASAGETAAAIEQWLSEHAR